jgi:iron complex outermembrane receptor protein
MRVVRVCVCVAAVAAIELSVAGGAAAQSVSQSSPDAAVELPEIVVTTTASPVATKKKRKTKAASAGPSALPTQGAPVPATTPALLDLPGGIAADQAFVAVTVTTAREIEANGGQTLTDTLMLKPGISGSTFAAGANRPIIRGLDNYRVRVQENGIATHDVSALSEDHAVPIDPFSAEQVEVVRGPATLRYGSQAIGGVVDATNDRIPDFVPLHGVSGEVQGGITSVDQSRDGGFQVTAGSNGVVLHADAFKRNADDYDTPQGVQENTFVESQGGAVGGSLVGTDGYLGLAYIHYESLYGIPGEDAVEERSRIDMNQDKILSKGEWRPHAGGVDAVRYWFGWSDYAHNELVDEGDVGSRFTNRETEGRVEVQHTPVMTGLGELTGAVGIQLGHRNLAGLSFEGGDNLLDPNSTDYVAGFIFEELQATKYLRLQAAARYEQNEVEGTGLDITTGDLVSGNPSFRPVSASLGALYDLGFDITARASAQYVERAPDATELFSHGPHEATGTFEIGDPNLTKEIAKTAELGLKKASGPLRFDGSVYYTKFDGFISKFLTGGTCGGTFDECSLSNPPDPPGPGDEFDELLFTQRDATFYGAELLVQYDVAPIWAGVWGVEGQYDFVHAKFDDGDYVPRMPPHRLGGGLYYRDAAWLARVNALHAFAQDELGFEETPTGSYTLVNAELSYTFTGEATHEGIAPVTTIGIRGENLLDDDVRNSASFKKDEVLLPGASVRLFGSVKLN